MEQYDLYFRGECCPGKEQQEVAESLKGALGLSAETVATLFCGKLLIIKKAVPLEVAKRYEKAFLDAGAILRRRRHPVECKPAAITQPPSPSPQEPPIQSADAESQRPRKKKNWVWTGAIGILFLVLFLLNFDKLGEVVAGLSGPSHPSQFIGTWSNKKGEFQTVTLGLRADGRGVMGASILPMLVRWEGVKDGIRVRAMLPTEGGMGRFIEYILAYDAKQEALLLSGKEGAQRLVKIDSKEPEDVESRVEESLRKENTRAENRLAQETIYFQRRQELLSKLPELVQSEGIVLSDKGQAWRIVIAHWDRPNSSPGSYLTVTTLTRGDDAPGGATKLTRYRDENVASLPIRFQMEAAALSGLKKKLDELSIKSEATALVRKSLWDIKGSWDGLQTGFILDQGTLITLVEYLLNETYAEPSDGYKVIISTENG